MFPATKEKTSASRIGNSFILAPFFKDSNLLKNNLGCKNMDEYMAKFRILYPEGIDHKFDLFNRPSPFDA